ncbi:MAG: hypothetical protein GY861_09425 [bacterium]|nr:hypothetical protein [bacterium]
MTSYTRIFQLFLCVLAAVIILEIVLLSDVLVNYSGIMTFYALVAIIILFVVKECINKRKWEKDDLNSLSDILRGKKQVESKVEYFKKRKYKDNVPMYSIALFDIELPLNVKGKSTKRLSNLIFYANDQIEVLNETIADLREIVLENLDEEPADFKKAKKKYIEFAEKSIKEATSKLDKCFDEVSENLLRWNIK